MNFSVNSRITEILRGYKFTARRFKLKNGLMDINETWYQQYRFTGVVYADDVVLLGDNEEILRANRTLY